MTVLIRLAMVAGLIGTWYFTQNLLGARGLPKEGIGDKIHQWMAPLHRYLQGHPRVVTILLITSSLGIDVLGAIVLYLGIFGRSFAPILGLAMLMLLRQTSQYLTALPAPEGMIWRNPGFPSVLVTYAVENDMFFSGHTALAVFGALTLASQGIPALTIAGIVVGTFEVLTVLALRAHWTMDVYAGIVTAVMCFWAANGLVG